LKRTRREDPHDRPTKPRRPLSTVLFGRCAAGDGLRGRYPAAERCANRDGWEVAFQKEVIQ